MTKKRKVGLISAVKRFYDNSKLAANALLRKTFERKEKA